MTSPRISPWGLTPSEARAMDAMIEHDGTKGAARALHRSPRTVDSHCSAACRKISANYSRLKHYILWDRWRREGATQ